MKKCLGCGGDEDRCEEKCGEMCKEVWGSAEGERRERKREREREREKFIFTRKALRLSGERLRKDHMSSSKEPSSKEPARSPSLQPLTSNNHIDYHKCPKTTKIT